MRVREIGGFDLENIPRTRRLKPPFLPTFIPVIFHGNKRNFEFRSTANVCLPFFKVVPRHDGIARFKDVKTLVQKFRLGADSKIILSGTDRDAPLERWWSLGAHRREVIRALKDLHIQLVTTPNYSMFTDRPRWDDMHSMKRIAVVHEEFLREGLPAALHVNARTEKDWERWIEYVSIRSEITHITFEFATGAKYGDRLDWYAKQLLNLAAETRRPLHLIMRGGAKLLPQLSTGFSRITFLDTDTFVKTRSRQRACLAPSGKIRWIPSHTDTNESLDELLDYNWNAVSSSLEMLLGERQLPLQAAGWR